MSVTPGSSHREEPLPCEERQGARHDARGEGAGQAARHVALAGAPLHGKLAVVIGLVAHGDQNVRMR